MTYKSLNELREGDVFLGWCENRLFKRNQNVICVTTGSTGSGKSMQDLRRMELHYLKHFKKKYPDTNERMMENVFFSIRSLINRLYDKSNPLIPGEIIMLEEAGAILSSHAWQDKSVKMFNYILQSFRSRGIMLIMNLPVFSMLNKSARQLCHFHFTMNNIDYGKKISISKGKYLQLSQESGKHYPKYFRIVVDNTWIKIKKYAYQLPSKELIDAYDVKKKEFVELNIEKLKRVEDIKAENEEKELIGTSRPFTEKENAILEAYKGGMTIQVALAQKLGRSQHCISSSMAAMTKKKPKWRENI